MKNTDEVMLIPQQEGFRAWRVKGGQEAQVEGESRSRRGVNWIAMPARSVVSVPMRFQGVDVSRRESAVQLELEAAGLGNETADTHNFEVRNLGSDDRDQRTVAFVQIAPLPAAVQDEGDDARYAPSVVFHKLVPGEAQIWREGSAWVLAVPHESGSPMHYQALAARDLDADAAAEIRCILGSLELSELSPNVQSICIVTTVAEGVDIEDLVSPAFAAAMEPVPVAVKREEPPTLPEQVARMVPAPVLKLRHDRQQRRMVMMGALAFAFVLIAALGAFAVRVALRERSVAVEEKRLDVLSPELTTIQDAKASWEDMRYAVTPELYPVEVFYQLGLLLPPDGVRVTRFELRDDSVVIDGEASSLVEGTRFRDKLVGAEAFKRWTWEFPSPTNLPDGKAVFHAEGRKAVPATDNTEVTQL